MISIKFDSQKTFRLLFHRGVRKLSCSPYLQTIIYMSAIGLLVGILLIFMLLMHSPSVHYHSFVNILLKVTQNSEEKWNFLLRQKAPTDNHPAVAKGVVVGVFCGNPGINKSSCLWYFSINWTPCSVNRATSRPCAIFGITTLQYSFNMIKGETRTSSLPIPLAE